MAAKNTIIIGAGVSGIAMAHTLRCRLGYTDFEVSAYCRITAFMTDNFSRSLKSVIQLEVLGKPTLIPDGESEEKIET